VQRVAPAVDCVKVCRERGVEGGRGRGGTKMVKFMVLCMEGRWREKRKKEGKHSCSVLWYWIGVCVIMT